MQNKSLKIKFGKNDLVLETGKLAKQANGSVTITYGATVILVTACMSNSIREGQDFFPLTVEYQEVQTERVQSCNENAGHYREVSKT